MVRNRVLPIVGAGFSRNAKLPEKLEMPLWNDLGRALAEELGYPYVNPIDTISAYEHEFSLPNLVERLEDLLHVQQASPGEAHLAFCRLPFDIVCTTNFDFLLEKGYEEVKRTCRVIVDESQLPVQLFESEDSKEVPTRRTTVLLKIHGDLNHPAQLILTEDHYDRFTASRPLTSTYLASLLIQRTPLFIGYSLEDPDFRSIWKLIGERLGKLRRNAYALAFRPSNSDVARFERRGVKVIGL